MTPLKLLRHLSRPLISSSSSTSLAAVSPFNFDTSPPPAILNFTNTKDLFQSFSTLELLRASATLHAAAVEATVDLGIWIMRSRLRNAFLVRDVIKHTFYEHFCAGESAAEAAEMVWRMKEAGLRGMLVYAAEDASDGEACDRNLEGFLETVESAKSLPPSYVSSVIVKISAICPIKLLERLSHLLRWEHKNPSFHLPWKLNTFPVFSDSSLIS